MLSDRMLTALNAQINAETYSAYLYLSMAAHFEERGLPGMANWMQVQYQEEMAHALKIYRYVVERGGRVELDAVAKPPRDWKSTLAVFEATREHERHVTELINGLATLAVELKDHATHAMLEWFVSEQVEEEANVEAIVAKLRLAGEQGAGLFMVDQELGARTFVDPNAGAQ